LSDVFERSRLSGLLKLRFNISIKVPAFARFLVGYTRGSRRSGDRKGHASRRSGDSDQHGCPMSGERTL
jgi:hypothetical protein